MRRTRSQTRETWPSHSNKHTDAALNLIHHILDAHDLIWHDKGRDPDCQFASFIHSKEKKEPAETLIQECRRNCRDWLLNHPPPVTEFTKTDWQDRVKRYGFAMAGRKRGDEHSLRGLAGAYATRINVIIVNSPSSHRTEKYDPPPTIPHTDEIWLIYLGLPHTRHYLSTTKIGHTGPELTLAPAGEAAGNATEIRRATGSTGIV